MTTRSYSIPFFDFGKDERHFSRDIEISFEFKPYVWCEAKINVPADLYEEDEAGTLYGISSCLMDIVKEATGVIHGEGRITGEFLLNGKRIGFY